MNFSDIVKGRPCKVQHNVILSGYDPAKREEIVIPHDAVLTYVEMTPPAHTRFKLEGTKTVVDIYTQAALDYLTKTWDQP